MVIKDNTMFEIILYKSVGPFEFGNDIDQYVPDFKFEFSPKETEDEDWDTYSFNNGMIDVFTRDGIIESIACRGDCYLEGNFLIGMNIDLFFSTFNIDKSAIDVDVIYFPDDTEQDVYDVDSLGLQIWVDAEDLIVTVFVSPRATD
jgi:hypothetical protein